MVPDSLRRLVALALIGGLGCTPTRDAHEIQTIANVAQGTTYTINWWSSRDVDIKALADAIANELARIDELLSNFRDDSVVERFNASRTVEVVELPAEIVRLLRVATDVHRASNGCFDPTVRPLVTLWGLNTSEPQIPTVADVAAIRERIGLDKLEIIDATHVRKAVAELELDFASIGQGYTVGRLAEIVASFSLDNYLVEIGGELAARGRKPNGEPWRIGIEEPTADGGVRRVLQLGTDQATVVITSGTYRHFFERDGRRYSHILDPTTGWPVEHELLSTTVVHTDPTLAAAWSTALTCLGPVRAPTAANAAEVAALLFVRVGDAIEERATANWPSALDSAPPR